MSKRDYPAYLKTAHWYSVRREAVERVGGRCQVCCSHEHLQVHHNTYANIGHEQDRDLIVMCDRCHRLFSEVMPSPPPRVIQAQEVGKWYPSGRSGEIVLELESTTDHGRIMSLLAEKMRIDRRR